MQPTLNNYEINPYIGEKVFEKWPDKRSINIKLFAQDIKAPRFYITPLNSTQLLSFRFGFQKHPPLKFYLTIDINVNGEKFKYIVKEKENQKRSSKPNQDNIYNFYSTIKEPEVGSKVTIQYRIQYHHKYTCSLIRKPSDCTCYLNSSLLLLFRLAKFRSFLFEYFSRDSNPSWIDELTQLFKIMCNSSASASTEQLTKAFGWPKIARRIQHDLGEFLFTLIYELADSIKDPSIKAKFDEIFSFTLISTANNSDRQNLYGIEIKQKPNGQQTIDKLMETALKGQKFLNFPEVLIISNNCQSKIVLSESLDLKQYADDENQSKNSEHKLVGFSQLSPLQNGGHYTTLFRLIDDDAWMYCNDTTCTEFFPEFITQSLTYTTGFEKVQRSFFPAVNSTIRNDTSVRVAIYVAKNLSKEYFRFSPKAHILKQSQEIAKPPTADKEIQVITDEDIENHIQLGHSDFKNISTSLKFVMKESDTNFMIYQRVAYEKNLDINKFILRSSKVESGAPGSACLSRTDHKIQRIALSTIRLYLEILPENCDQDYNMFYIPLYFLLFRFKPSIIRYNLAKRSYLYSKTEPQTLKDYDPESLKIDPVLEYAMNEKNAGRRPKNQCLHLLQKIVMKKSDNFASVIPILIKALGVDSNTKINLYAAVYKGSLQVGYKKLDLGTPLFQNIDLTSGMYIYVQIVDNYQYKSFSHLYYLNRSSTDELNQLELKMDQSNDEIILDQSNELKPNLGDPLGLHKSNSLSFQDTFIVKQFIFFKYYQDIHHNMKCFPAELPNVFLMEKFSVPLEFCKFSSHTKQNKSLLFPVTLSMTIDTLKRFICHFMDEKFPENGKMQLFFGFKQSKIPFANPIPDKEYQTNKDVLFQNVFYFPLNLKFADIHEKEMPSFYFKCKPEIQIHYVIFPEVPESAIHKTCSVRSYRLYFSEDGLTVPYIRQVLKVDDHTNVEQIMNSVLDIFVDDNNRCILSKYDQEKFAEIKSQSAIRSNDGDIDSPPAYAKYYRVLQIKNSMISKDFVHPSEIPYNEIEYRIERIPIYESRKPISHIRVSYGAQYNQTKYIAPLGIPFLFDVFDDELDPCHFTDENAFVQTETYQRLLSRIRIPKDRYAIYVVNFSGIKQSIQYYEFDKIVNDSGHLNLSICIKKVNSAEYVDPENLFSTIKIIQ